MNGVEVNDLKIPQQVSKARFRLLHYTQGKMSLPGQ